MSQNDSIFIFYKDVEYQLALIAEYDINSYRSLADDSRWRNDLDDCPLPCFISRWLDNGLSDSDACLLIINDI